MRSNKIPELISYGEMINVKVTKMELRGEPGVFIRDQEFTDFIGAVLYLKQIHATELPDNEHLVA